MKKELLLIAAAATMLTACVNMDTIQSVDDYDAPSSIGFSTFTGYQTKAENSSATKKHSLGNYHKSFQVWGSKTVNSTTSTVFNGQIVTTGDATSAEGTYTAETAAAHNASLEGAIAAGTALTGTTLTAVNGLEGRSKTYAENEEIVAADAALYNATLPGAVAASDIKEAVYDWTYSPKVFWDKSATLYTFNAAAPAGIGWAFANDKISLDNFSVDGTTIEASSTVDPRASFGEKDIMISEDIDNWSTYTSAPVNLSFIHLLSRLNIGVRKDETTLSGHIVKLKSITVYNLNSNGKFTESAANATSDTPGGIARWSAPTDGQDKFTLGKGFSTLTVVTTDFKYVYQALAIPQQVDYESGIKLNGSNADEDSKPFLNISYEILVNYTAEEAAEYNAQLEGAIAAGTALTGGTLTAVNGLEGRSKTYAENEEIVAADAALYNATLEGHVTTESERKLDDYSYTYNLADMFNGNGSSDNIIFGEGWMNTLKITINPIAIDFDAEVYEWAEANNVEVEIQPELVTPTPLP